MSTDRHKTTPKAVRMPDGLLAWYEQHAKATDRAVNAALVAAFEEYRARQEGGSTAPAARVRRGSTTSKPREDAAPPVVLREPKGGKCEHRVPVGAYCRTCDKIKER